jgi:thiamine-monophosphate kinase
VSSVSELTERELIGRIQARLPSAPNWLTVGVGDDAAVVETARNRLEVLTVDALVEGVHFDRAFTPPAAIGHRALAVNLSDLAAMGATPRLGLLALALPRAFPLDHFDRMIAGLTDLAARFRLTIAGGNLTRIDGPLVLDVTVTGTVKRRQVLTRRGARPGDDLYVTGSIGSAAAGLQKLRSTDDCRLLTVDCRPSTDVLIERFLFPEPRVRLGELLGRNRAAVACIDLSDGLADAVHQIAEASGVGAIVDADRLPIESAATRWFESQGSDPVQSSITGGDDYELLFAVRPALRRRLTAAARHGDAPLTRIGACTADRAVLLRRDGTEQPLPQGFSHFR